MIKKDFIVLNEDDLMFITNPGRMGDEDGLTFIIKKDNEFTTYRVDGLMYPNKNIKKEDRISMKDITKQFPKWYETWQHSNEKNYKGKYKYLYMGFGNGLSIDNSIYEEYKPYLDKAVEEDLKNYKEEEKKEMKYAAIFSVWKKALREMAKEKNILIK